MPNHTETCRATLLIAKNSENPKLKHIYINSIFAKNESKFTPYAYKQLVIINRS